MKIRNHKAREIVGLLRGDSQYVITEKPLEIGESYHIYLRPLKTESLTRVKRLGFVLQSRKHPLGKPIQDCVIGWYEINKSIALETKEIIDLLKANNLSSITVKIDNQPITLYDDDLPKKETFYLNLVSELRIYPHPMKLSDYQNRYGKPLKAVRDLQEVKLYD